MTDTTAGTGRELTGWERRPVLLVSNVVSVMAVLAVLPMGSMFFVVLRVAIATWAVLTVVHAFRVAPKAAGLSSLRVWPFLSAAVAAGVL